MGDVFRSLADKFKEAITKIVLCSDEGFITYQSHAELPITVLRSQLKYTYQFNGEELNLDEESEIPSDISEGDLVNMLTECMAIIILKNKDSKIVDAINLFNPEVQLPKPDQQRKRDKKLKGKQAVARVADAGSVSETSENQDNYLVVTNPYFYKLSKRAKI